MNIGKLGVFSFLDQMTASESAVFARMVEQLGYGALWYPEAVGRKAVSPFSLEQIPLPKFHRTLILR